MGRLLPYLCEGKKPSSDIHILPQADKILQLIRRAAKISEGHEESVFKPIGWEEFSTKTARLESLPQLAPESQTVLELVRDALELKKLNNNLMKITMFEDLIADLYARLYEINVPHLVEETNDENKEKMKVDHLLMVGEGPTETSNPPTSVPASDTPAPRGRTKGIARRDIQKRADTIVNTKLAPRAVASKLAAAGETDAPATPQGPGSTSAGPTSAARGSVEVVISGGDATAEQRDGHDGEETEMSEPEDTKLDEGTSALFPHVTDAEEMGTGDEGADEGNEEDDEGDPEHEGEEGDGVTYGDGDEDEEMQDEETKLDEEDEKNVTADQSANDTETEPVHGKQDSGEQDGMEITPAES